MSKTTRPDERYYAGMHRFSSKEQADKHAAEMEEKGWVTTYHKGSTHFRSSHRLFPHRISHYYRDKDHYNAARRARYAKNKVEKLKEEGQIAELSNNTLKSYVGKSLNQYVNATTSPEYANHDSKQHKTAIKRMSGLNMADRNLKKEEAPTNAVGGGNIAGVGVGPDGEPGVKPKAMKRYKDKNASSALIPFKTFMRNAKTSGITEQTKTTDFHAGLEKIGIKMRPRPYGGDREYESNHHIDKVHKVVSNDGYKKRDVYTNSDGAVTTVYTKEAPYVTHKINVHQKHRDKPVYFIRASSHTAT